MKDEMKSMKRQSFQYILLLLKVKKKKFYFHFSSQTTQETHTLQGRFWVMLNLALSPQLGRAHQQCLFQYKDEEALHQHSFSREGFSLPSLSKDSRVCSQFLMKLQISRYISMQNYSFKAYNSPSGLSRAFPKSVYWQLVCQGKFNGSFNEYRISLLQLRLAMFQV